MFPNLAVDNPYYLGDGVILEAAASTVARSLGKRVYVRSRFPELYKGHPALVGLDGTEVDKPECLKYMGGVTEALLQHKDKLGGTFDAASLSPNAIRAPELLLTPVESSRAKEIRRLFLGNCIGVVLGSRNEFKSWSYTAKLVKRLVKRGDNVFSFADNLTDFDPGAVRGTHRVIGRDLRDAMVYLSIMDAVIGPDTGPMHIAAALGVPTVVICEASYSSLYAHYKSCTILPGRIVRRAVRSVPVAAALVAIDQALQPRPWEFEQAAGEHCFVRIKGIGDVFLTLVGLATLRSLDGDSKYTYVTSPGMARVLSAASAVDEAIGVPYEHPTSGLPTVPDTIDYSRFDTVTNAINAVDFTSAAASTPRAELFGRLMGLDQVDYTTDWQLHPPKAWMDAAWEKLATHGVKRGEKLLALQVDTEGLSRQWQRERWIEFSGLAGRAGYTVVVVSDKRHRKVHPKSINTTAELSLTEYVGLVAESTVLVGPDSAGVHIAGVLGVPAVGLFGSVDPALRIAHYPTVRAIVGKASCTPCNDWQLACCEGKKHMPVCIWNIRPRDILRAVDQIMSALPVERVTTELGVGNG